MGDIMGGNVKLKSKVLIKGDTIRLFGVGLVSFALRWGTFILLLYSVAELLKSGIIDNYLENYGPMFVYTVIFADLAFLGAVLVLFISAIRLGEQFLYFIKASGGRGRFLLLFHFCTFKRSIKAFVLYFRLFLFKFVWLIYYMFPCVLCYGLTAYLYFQESLLPAVFYILIAGSSLLFSYCLFMWRITSYRYSAAAYYISLKPHISVKEAIRKSICFTDGFLREYALEEGSFFGWLLSCVLIIPAIYVIPYFKVSKALFTVESISIKNCMPYKSDYAITYLSLNDEELHTDEN